MASPTKPRGPSPRVQSQSLGDGPQFNLKPPNVMYLDLNSCFASVEQQANPLLRDKPIAVVHTDAPYGCILAPSIEAKLWGIKTGMTLWEARQLCPWLIPRVADPPKYRQVHKQIGELLNNYSSHVVSKSIDEFVLTLPQRTVSVPKGSDLEGRAQPRPDNQRGRSDPQGIHEGTVLIGKEIKSRIRTEIGQYLRVSIGVSTNQVLAKLASDLHKPDGFDVIDSSNALKIYNSIALADFCGINVRNIARLHRVGIFTPLQFYRADIQTLTSAFQSVLGRYWYTRLRGYETDDKELARCSFGQSYVLPHSMSYAEWRPILAKLVAKAARRLRASGFTARSVALDLRFEDGSTWHSSNTLQTAIFSDLDLLLTALSLQRSDLCKKVKKIAFTCYTLNKDSTQLSCLSDILKQSSLTNSLDQINDRWGEYTITYGSMFGTQAHVKDAIAFGR